MLNLQRVIDPGLPGLRLSLFALSPSPRAVPSPAQGTQRKRCACQEPSAPSQVDQCQQLPIRQSPCTWWLNEWNQKSRPSQGGDLTKHAGAGPSLPVPANKRPIVQPRQSHDITTTQAAVPVKNQFGSQDN